MKLRQGSVAEWSKALVLGTSHFGGVGSNPTTIKLNIVLSNVLLVDIVFQITAISGIFQ